MGGVASTIGNTVGEAVKEVEIKKPQEEQEDEMEIFKRKLEKLKIMKENGILTEEELEQEKKKLLENL